LWFERQVKSPAWLNFKGWWRQADVWVEKNLDLDELFHWIGHRRRRIAMGFAAVLLAAYACTSLTVIAPDELAVVRRFGRAVDDLGPGWHLRWPWPIEDVVRVSGRVRTVEIGFRDAPGAKQTPQTLTWSSPHRDNREGDEALMITGDGNLVELQAVIRYRVVQPRLFLLGINGPDELVRAAGESVLRGAIAGRPFHELLTVQRRRFQREASAQLRERLKDYDGLGIEVEEVSLLDLHPPIEVVGAYYMVAKAMERRDWSINTAEQQATQKIKAAQADSAKIVAQARAGYIEKTRQAQGQTARFLARSRGRRELDGFQEFQLTLAAADAVLRGQSVEAALAEQRRQRERLQLLQGALTDFRVYWDTLGGALLGRELVLIDADNIKGQRNLFLFDADQLRAPMVVPGNAPAPPANP
jgi:regulator of protease activity HflC (stomatin/prohibitin superfamily)